MQLFKKVYNTTTRGQNTGIIQILVNERIPPQLINIINDT